MLISNNFAESFCKHRRNLIKQHSATWGKVNVIEMGGLSVLEIPSPQLLAGFSSYLKFQCRGRKVYFRGEKYFFRSTTPSLFRDISEDKIHEIATRKQAFDELVASLPSLYKVNRFQEDFKPLLQHYGIRTDWLDLVDNIFVALWFSNNGSKEAFSYVKFFIDTDLLVRNLREDNTSLNLRPHCQHGLSATKELTWNSENIDFGGNMIAIAKLPNIPEMKLSGYIFSDNYMFPNEELDNTYKLLKANKFQKNLDKITSRHGLSKDALGWIR